MLPAHPLLLQADVLCLGTSLLPAPKHVAGTEETLPHRRDPFSDHLPCLLPASTRETKPPALLLGSMAQQPDEMTKLWGTVSSGEELRCLSLPTEVKSQPCDCPVLCQTGSEEESKAQKQDLVSPPGCALPLQEGKAPGCLTGSPGMALGREALPSAGLGVGSPTSAPQPQPAWEGAHSATGRGCGGERRDKQATGCQMRCSSSKL